MRVKKRYLFVAGWVGLGFFNFGTMNAELAWEYRHELPSLHRSQRDEIGTLVFESCILPPFELFSSAFMSNFWQHGWDVTSKPWREQPSAEKAGSK